MRSPHHPLVRTVTVMLALSAVSWARADEGALLAPAGAPAVPGDERTPPEYAEHVELGVTEHGRGHFEEARMHFAEAHRLFPNARTLRALGKVEFELRNYGEASALLRQALDSEVRPLQGELRGETERLLARALEYVGELHVDVEPDSATVSVDGVVVARGPIAKLYLRVGEHELEFRAEGRTPERRRVHIQGGEHTRLQVELPSVLQVVRTGGEQTSAAAAPVPMDTRHWYRRWPVWVSAAAVVLVGGVTAGLLARRGHHTSELAEPIGTSQTPPGGTIPP